MKKRLCLYYIGCILTLIFLVTPAIAAEVAQGKTVTNDTKTKLITIEEYGLKFTPENKYGNPTGKTSVFDLSDALIGAEAVPGDIVRIAYKVVDGKNKAIRIMNVTKQDVMKK
ncbi:MAG: hypothetical protein V1897_10555 [Pseudomonadota bacterium]